MRGKPVTTARGGGSSQSVGVRCGKSFPLLVLETDPNESEPREQTPRCSSPRPALTSRRATAPPQIGPLSPTPLLAAAGCREKLMLRPVLTGHQALNP